MTQVAVCLTDYGLAVECLGFGLVFLFRGGGKSPMGFAGFFLSIALAGMAGGTVHGFFVDEGSSGYRILWPLTLIAMGVTALLGTYAGARLSFIGSIRRWIKIAALAIFLVYVAVILFVRQDFLMAILDYGTAMIFLGLAFWMEYRRRGRMRLLVGFVGICTMLFAAVGQQAKLGIDPRYFDYNAVYHVLQAIALWMVFLAARESVSREGLNA